MLTQQSNNGFSTLAHIDQRLQGTREQLHRIERNAEIASQRLASISNDESALYAELAAIKLGRLDNVEQVRNQLGGAERQAKVILAQREQAIGQLVAETEHSLTTQTELEQERKTLAEALETLAETLHQQVQRTHEKLAEQDSYRAAQTAAQQAVDVVDAADLKAQRSSKEHRAKSRDYDNDRIFTYLWQRRYGTQDYRAGRFTRLLDRWVADHIGFEEQRRNYYMLREIPKRLDAHVDSLRERAESLMAELERLQHDAELADGIIDLETELKRLQEQLDEADQAIEKEEIHYAQCLTKRDEFAQAQDKLYLQAIAILSEGLRNQSLESLTTQAEASVGYEDDSLVSRLGDLRQEKRSVKQTQQATQRSSAKLAERLHNLEGLRRDFKRRRFDAPHSQFRNSDAVVGAIDDFVGGLIGITDLWRVIDRHQRFVRRRTYPNYGRRPGSVRFPRGIRIPSNWGGMGSGGLGGGIRLPRGGGGGGGFKTGGGF